MARCLANIASSILQVYNNMTVLVLLHEMKMNGAGTYRCEPSLGRCGYLGRRHVNSSACNDICLEAYATLLYVGADLPQLLQGSGHNTTFHTLGSEHRLVACSIDGMGITITCHKYMFEANGQM
jgi:hypothetical protein